MPAVNSQTDKNGPCTMLYKVRIFLYSSEDFSVAPKLFSQLFIDGRIQHTPLPIA